MTLDRHVVYSLPRVRQAWRDVRRRSTAAGIDGWDVHEFEPDADRLLEALAHGLQRGTHRYLPALLTSRRKPDGGKRRIAIPTVQDRIAQRALALALQRMIDPNLHRASHAYRPGIGVAEAVAVVRASSRLGYAARFDVDECFPSLDWERMDDALASFVPDRWVRDELHAIRTCGIVHRRRFEMQTVGLAQGSPVAPLLCNVVLHALDEQMDQPPGRFVRYADDMVFAGSSEEECEASLERARTILAGLRMRLSEEKTWVGSYVQGFRYLGTDFVGGYAFPAIPVRGSDGVVRMRSGYEGDSPELRHGWRVPYGASWE